MVHIVFSVDFYSVYLYSMSILFVVTLDIFSINVPIYIYTKSLHMYFNHMYGCSWLTALLHLSCRPQRSVACFATLVYAQLECLKHGPNLFIPSLSC